MSAWRPAWLLVRLRARRLVNLLFTRSAGRAPAGRRQGTARKGRGLLLAFFVGLYLPGIGFFLANQVVDRLVGRRQAPTPDRAGPLAVELAVLACAALLTSLSSRELSKNEGDLEWLATLPVTTPVLLASRLAQRALVAPGGWLLIWPLLGTIGWRAGHRAPGLLFGGLATLALLVIIAAAWALLEMGLRVWLSPPRLRNFEAVVGIATVPLYWVAVGAASGRFPIIARLGDALPPGLLWTPPGLAATALASPTVPALFARLALLWVEALALAALAVLTLAALLREGFVRDAGRESGGRLRRGRVSPSGGTTRPGGWLTPLQRRELRLLGRDRSFLVQTLVLPVVIIAGQFFLGGGRVPATGGLTWAHFGSAAFGLAAYTLMSSAFQTLNSEGASLWLLYTFPRPLAALLREKTNLWTGFAGLYALAVLGYAAGTKGLRAEAVGVVLLALFGIPVFATIAAALGVFGSDPLADEPRRRLRITYVYLYMTIAGAYGYSFYADRLSTRLVLVALIALLAVALWQKASDQLPYLLDPAAAPPSRISLADGLGAVLLFFLLQVIAGAVLSHRVRGAAGAIVTLSFALAGGVTFVVVRLLFWRAGTLDLPRVFRPAPDAPPRPRARVALESGGAALALGLFGMAYLRICLRLPAFWPAARGWLQEVRFDALAGQATWLLPLAVVAAPLCEEFLFRGLVFQGLRRSVGRSLATVGSAAIFALVHPPLSMLPVFLLGCACALIYSRARTLWGPMLVHAGYNALVLSDQLWWLGR